MALSRRVRTYLTLGIVVAVLAIGGAVTYFIMTRYFQQGESTEIRGRASVGPTGTATVTLETQPGTRYVKDQFPVDIFLDTGNTPISAAGLRVYYPTTGTTPELEVIDADPSRAGVQLISFSQQAMPNCTEQINNVTREPSGERRVYVDFSIVCTGDGYTSSGKQLIGTILFQGNAAGTKTIEHDPARAIVTRKSDGADTLTGIAPITIAIQADTAAPTVEFTGDSLITRTDSKLATNSAQVRFDWKGTEAPGRPSDTVLLDQYVTFQYRVDTGAWTPANYTQDKTVTLTLAHNVAAGHTIQLRGRDRNGNVSAPISKNFLVDLTPTISSVEPTHAAGGEEITINGFNFGTTKNQVYFGTVRVTGTAITSWLDSKVVVKVPSNANGGTVRVVPSGRPTSNTVPFNLDSKLRIVMNLQGLGQDRGAKKVDVTISRGTYEANFTGLDAVWSAADSAYVVLTPPLPDAGLATATNYVVSVKEGSRLRKRFTGASITRGSQKTFTKKAAADVMKVGDVNGDNKISILDFSEMVKPGNFTGLSNPVTDATRKYDLNGDGALTAADISLLLTNYTQLETLGDAAK